MARVACVDEHVSHGCASAVTTRLKIDTDVETSQKQVNPGVAQDWRLQRKAPSAWFSRIASRRLARLLCTHAHTPPSDPPVRAARRGRGGALRHSPPVRGARPSSRALASRLTPTRPLSGPTSYFASSRAPTAPSCCTHTETSSIRPWNPMAGSTRPTPAHATPHVSQALPQPGPP